MTRGRLAEFVSAGPFTELKDPTAFLTVFAEGNVDFLPRDEAEQSTTHKQIIPYVALVNEKQEIFAYRRNKAGGESRLHDQWSIGIGGHINSQDGEGYEALKQGTQRELHEEINLQVKWMTLLSAIIGLINHDEDDVGRVHTGIAIVLKLDDETIQHVLSKCEHTMDSPQMVPIKSLVEQPDVHQMALERWSGILVHHLYSKIFAIDGKWNDNAFRERVTLLTVAAGNLAASSASFLLQDDQKGHEITKEMVETAAGEVQCMLAGTIANEDINGVNVKRAGQNFHAELDNILKHQAIQK